MAANQASNVQTLDIKIISLNISGLRTKTAFLKHFLIQNKPDILCLQETNISDNYSRNKAIFELGLEIETSFFNYPNSKSNGTAIFCISPNLKVVDVSMFDEGRTIFLKLSYDSVKFMIVNIYAPTNPTQRRAFFDSLSTKIENNSYNKDLVVAGDFNITTQDIDITGISGTNRIGRPELNNIIRTFKLKDAFRALFPSKVETTFHNKNISRAARLDRIYVSEHYPIAYASHIASTLHYTDHKAVSISLSNVVSYSNKKNNICSLEVQRHIIRKRKFCSSD